MEIGKYCDKALVVDVALSNCIPSTAQVRPSDESYVDDPIESLLGGMSYSRW